MVGGISLIWAIPIDKRVYKVQGQSHYRASFTVALFRHSEALHIPPQGVGRRWNDGCRKSLHELIEI